MILLMLTGDDHPLFHHYHLLGLPPPRLGRPKPRLTATYRTFNLPINTITYFIYQSIKLSSKIKVSMATRNRAASTNARSCANTSFIDMHYFKIYITTPHWPVLGSFLGWLNITGVAELCAVSGFWLPRHPRSAPRILGKW